MRRFILLLIFFTLMTISAQAHMLWLNVSNYYPDVGDIVWVEIGWGHKYPRDEVIGEGWLEQVYAINPKGEKVFLEKIFPSFYRFVPKLRGAYLIVAKLKPGFVSITTEGHKLGNKKQLKNVVSCFKYIMNAKALIEVGGKSNGFSCITGEPLEIIPLKDPYGVTVEDPRIEALVTSPFTHYRGIEINKLRERKGFKPLDIIVCPLVMAKDGKPISSTRIMRREITPKGETQLSPEEKLLRAIFGDKAGDVKDTSLRVPPGVEGIVIDAKVFARKGVEKDSRSLAIETAELARLEKDKSDEIEVVGRAAKEKLKGLLLGLKLKTELRDTTTGKPLHRPKKEITDSVVDSIPLAAWANADLKASMDVIEQVETVVEKYSEKIERIQELFEEKIERLSLGDELAPGVIKMVKIYVAVKRKLSVGDKMAGRHGNKGVLSRILPIEDMPYFEDGTPVDIVLNPLGVPSRMNVGQVLETHLGWAAKELGRQIGEMVEKVGDAKALRKKFKDLLPEKEYDLFVKDATEETLVEQAGLLRDGIPMATPVFDGAEEDEIMDSLQQAGLPITGQTTLYDGRSGEPFDQQVTVGIMYVMKLHHLVDDKLHARSIGPYSLVTQQPLGGKAQFGGQRLGEMEVWAMEAYGAAYALQEFLTVKSDDVAGRTRMYERIVKGNNVLEAGLPESFKVLMKELQSLGLEIELFEDSQA